MNLKIIRKPKPRNRSKIHSLQIIEQLQKDNYEINALNLLAVANLRMAEKIINQLERKKK